jgi:hypothetical protein
MKMSVKFLSTIAKRMLVQFSIRHVNLFFSVVFVTLHFSLFVYFIFLQTIRCFKFFHCVTVLSDLPRSTTIIR